ncbi:MAG: acyl-CoA/acyl-ACP dehydrogenase [Leptolyngbya sp. SIO1E4]|nr:acyl-CoA/acyl-ACP dehydrogenase [Leptolyngbya sp. SIO1E4]
MHQEHLLGQVRSVLDDLFSKSADLYQRPFTKEHWMQLVDVGIMVPCIPSPYGGKLSTKTTFHLLAIASYFALPLSLRIMIIQLLFTSTLVKHASSATKDEIFPRLMAGEIGGIAITEPDHGSDALGMQTYYCPTHQGYSISGMKHWQGLSGETEWFLIAARAKTPDGKLAGNVDFFLHEMSQGGMQIAERYHTPGLLMMQYGKNEINVEIPTHRKLTFPSGKRNPLIMDVFNTARLAFPAMGLGFFTRIQEEAESYAELRQVNKKALKTYDLVKFRLEHLRAWKTICAVLFEHSLTLINVYQPLADKTLLADVYKVIISDLMLKASHSLQQLYGGMGYRRFSFPEMAFADSRPFQILDGSNDILSMQIAWLLIKDMQARRIDNFPQFLQAFELTKLADVSLCDRFMAISPNYDMPQRSLMQLGQLLARVVVVHCLRDAQRHQTLQEGDVECALTVLKTEMHQLFYELVSA